MTYLTGGDGKRRSATVASVETNYRWDAGYTVLNEEDDSGDLERTFVGRNTAQIEGDDAATGDYFYHTHDHLGSTRNVYAQNKDDAAAFEYTPYGRELFTTNRALTTRGYTGHTREAALGGGYYAPFRYYLPNLARWEKRDPLGMVDGPNVYGYVRGNPVNLWDPMGLSYWDSLLNWFGGRRGDLVDGLLTCGSRVGGRLANAAGVALVVGKLPPLMARWTPSFIGIRPGKHIIQTNTRKTLGFYTQAITIGGVGWASLFGNLLSLSDYAVNPYNEWVNPGLQSILDQQAQDRCESDDERTWSGWLIDEALGCPWLR